MVWLEEDHDGQPMPKRRRTGEKRKRSSATGTSRSVDLVCTPSTSGQESETGTTQSLDSLIQEVQELLGLPSEEPLSSQWKKRQASSLEKSSMVEGFLRPLSPSTHITEDEGGKFSYHERECFIPIMHPCCDCATGQTSVSAGKEIILIGINGRYNLFLPQINCTCGKTWSIGMGDLVESGYWPATVNFETLYAVDLFTTYEDLKITAPGMSRQAFVSMLEHRTKLFGRSGKICGDTLQKSFLEWTYAKFESQPGPCGFFDGVFLAKDAEVSSFVDYIHGTTRHNPAKGRCGSGQWSAARETANKSASKLDEEGVEKQLSSRNVQFFCSDVVCKYWPYLQRVASHCPELQNLLNMRPFLSIMHAKAHSWLCELRWGGRNQKGAGNTIGEEVEQVNSFLSRAAIHVCSKYMSKAVRTDMLTIQASGWNKRKAANLEQTLAKRYMKTVQRITEATEDLEKLTAELLYGRERKTIEGLYLSIKQRKYQLYRQSGGNKRRHKLRKKIVEEKKALEDAITEHNAVAGEADKLPPPNKLLAEDNYSWKWECHGDMVQKKKVYDKVMLLTRLKEEAVILVHEVKQHWEYMRSVAGKIDHLSSQLSEGITGQSSTEALTERGREGLLCVLKKQLHQVKAQQAMARIAYQCILGQQTVSLDDSSEEQPSDSSSSTDEEL
ncbi:hypothetical protein KUCAC02_019573 [Chaenocephalus aceratus]|uniref:Uncharacterized protein n=1 Tax=Chaenocephalus aceratus TaxID=36190 RepID=A0ACB9VNS3_CHAAC|nr:hypothetical protein KUCAC02_019573 [Chaenocephalus aceratus]